MPIWMILAGVAILGLIVFCVVGLVRQLAASRRQRHRGTTTTGMVVDVEFRVESVGDGGMTTRVPTVEFTDPHGNRRQFKSRVSVPDCPLPGGSLPVWYDPDDPGTEAEVVDTRPGCSAAGYVAGIVIGVLLALGAVWFNATWLAHVR